MCECYQIGGRFIAEDPDCPVHGRDNLPSQIERLEAKVERLEAQRKELRDMLDRVQRAGTWPDISMEIDSVLKATQ